MIQDIMLVINEKRQQIYLLQSTNDNLEKEIKFYLYEYDTIKLNNDIRVLYYLLSIN